MDPVKFSVPKTSKHKLILNMRDPVARKPPVSVSLGCHALGAVPPRPSDDPVSAGSGACKRIATNHGRMSRKTKRKFARFVELFCKRWFKPLDPSEDFSTDSWLAENTTYSAGRKTGLSNVFNQSASSKVSEYTFHPGKVQRVYRVNNFIKDEFLSAYKHPRMINSRSDTFKVTVGPVVSKVAKVVFNLKYPERDIGPLIKYTPVADRPVVLSQLLDQKNNKTFQITDYSSFEALFTEELMKICQMQLFKHMLQKISFCDEFISLLRSALLGNNQIYNKYFKMIVKAKRMSGEMDTSLSNGFTNMMLTFFTANQKHVSQGYVGNMESWINNYHEYVTGVFEGDDGLCVFHPNCHPTTKDFTQMGVIIKLEDVPAIGLASFCGNLFDPIDLIQVCDPIKVVASIGWSNKKYVKASQQTRYAILRCKANSYLNQYRGAPIIQSLAAYILRTCPEDVERELRYVENSGHWMKGKYSQAYTSLNKTLKLTPRRTRLLVEQLFNIPIDVQITFEKYLDSLIVLQPLNVDCLMQYIPHDYIDNYYKHVIPVYDEGSIISLNEKKEALEYVDYMAKFQPSINALKELF